MSEPGWDCAVHLWTYGPVVAKCSANSRFEGEGGLRFASYAPVDWR